MLAKKQAIVTRLAAIEELAGVDILCSDKTGTLTQNKLTLGTPFTTSGNSPDEVILNAALASRAEDKDSIDLAGHRWPKKRSSYPKPTKSFIFNRSMPSINARKATVKSQDGKQFKVTKGAPQVILQMSTNKSEISVATEKSDQ